MGIEWASGRNWLLALLFLACTLGLGYVAQQSSFFLIAPLYGLFFLGYGFLFQQHLNQQDIQFFLFLAVLLRLLLVFTLPNLSDDIYRFIWDGRLLINGGNPFEHLPTYYLEQGSSIPGINQDLFEKLNSPAYFTIYPPVAQANFAIACWLFPNSLLGSAIVMKLFLLGFEIGSLYLIRCLLQQFKLPAKNILLYALNPLIIIEIIGNLHFEGGMIFFLLLAYYLLTQEKWLPSALAMAFAIASKLLPLIFLPFLIKRLGWRRSFIYFSVVGVALLLLFLPIFNASFIENFGNSLDLYFRKFEFNASVYYLARWVGYQQVGYNLIARIGPMLAMATLLSISILALVERKPNWAGWAEKMLFAICIYLLFTTTVHPWYVSLPLVLCLFTRFGFPVLWSALVTLTYINYSYESYYENLWIVGIEYVLVLLLFAFEFFVQRQKVIA